MIAERKVALLLLVLLAVAFVGIVFWIFLSQKSAPVQNERSDLKQVIKLPPAESVVSPSQSFRATTTPGLKIYRNEEWGFEFEYPEGWTLHENTFGGPFSKFNLVGASPEEDGHPNPILPSLLVNIVTPDFVERQFSDLNDIALETVVGGARGLKYEYKEQAWYITIILPLGQNKIILSTTKGYYEDVLNQILSTFKFIE